jgi:hypothetical protein
MEAGLVSVLRGLSGRPSRAVAVGLAATIAGVLLGTSVWALLAYAASRPVRCPTISGGVQGGEAQLQHLYVGDRSVTFAFANSSAGPFDVPRYTGDRSADGSVTLTFVGASTRQPDGTTSYDGPTSLDGASPIGRVGLVEDARRSMRWRVGVEENVCPQVATLRFWTGSYSKALVIVTFGDVSTLTLEQAARPAKAPIWVNGSGFAAGRTVTLAAAGEVLRETKTDRAGMFSTAIYTPEARPGDYVLVARDDAGHRAETRLTVLPGLWP